MAQAKICHIKHGLSFFFASYSNKVDLKLCDLVFSSLLWHTSKWNGFVHLPWDHCRLLIAAISWLTGFWRTEVLVPPSHQCTCHWCRCEMEGKLMFLLKDYKRLVSLKNNKNSLFDCMVTIKLLDIANLLGGRTLIICQSKILEHIIFDQT